MEKNTIIGPLTSVPVPLPFYDELREIVSVKISVLDQHELTSLQSLLLTMHEQIQGTDVSARPLSFRDLPTLQHVRELGVTLTSQLVTMKILLSRSDPGADVSVSLEDPFRFGGSGLFFLKALVARFAPEAVVLVTPTLGFHPDELFRVAIQRAINTQHGCGN